MTIKKRTDEFKSILTDKTIKDKDIVQRYIGYGDPFVFNNDQSKYFELKKIIADGFRIHPNEVTMVGSAKLGFSIAPNKLWAPFNDESDIDMAIISEKIFTDYWKDLYKFDINRTVRTTREQALFEKFLDYFFKGWLRPDLFPFSFNKRNAWFDFFTSISYQKFGEQKIRCGLFRNNYFFENYHTININKIRQGVI